MCLAMKADRQGPDKRTHLVSPARVVMRWLPIGLLAVVFAGCNTAQGVKKDVAIGVDKTGEALQKSGEAVGNALNKTGDAVGGALKKSGEAVQKKVE